MLIKLCNAEAMLTIHAGGVNLAPAWCSRRRGCAGRTGCQETGRLAQNRAPAGTHPTVTMAFSHTWCCGGHQLESAISWLHAWSPRTSTTFAFAVGCWVLTTSVKLASADKTAMAVVDSVRRELARLRAVCICPGSSTGRAVSIFAAQKAALSMLGSDVSVKLIDTFYAENDRPSPASKWGPVGAIRVDY